MKNLGVFVAGIVLMLLLSLPAFAATAVGEVSRMQGRVTAVAGDGNKRILQIGSQVYESDIISTGLGARIEFTMMDDSTIVLSDQTHFSIQNYRFDESAGTSNILMKLMDGAFRMITQKVGKLQSPRLQVVTPYGIVGARGTDFWGGFFKNTGKFGVLMLSGRGVYVISKGQTVELTQAGQGTELSPMGVVSSGNNGKVRTRGFGAKAGKGASPVKKWAPGRVNEALASVAFE